MGYRDELARRMKRAPLSARQIAKQAKLSPAWVAAAASGDANITPETAERIHRAMDELIDPVVRGRRIVVHPGVDALLTDEATCSALRVTDDDRRDLRAAYLGEGVRIMTVDLAVAILRDIRSARELTA